ncbi:MAG: nucleoside-diphosphate kinase [Abditibacteriales bacterium]|nr:nucleoside-diphosphate kinase [Abditibacteriales bacterium]MDW8364390.1 nucleoside-diphosphate kinase [Abditibacteriales bacterium]
MSERTLVLIKPDGVERGLIGEIIRRFEQKGLKIVGLKMLRVTPELAREHYRDHVGKPFYEPLVAFITQGPVVAIAVEGTNAIARVRQMMGALDPADALPGTIRGDFVIDRQMNVIHGSDSPENAARELNLFFNSEELITYTRSVDRWIS